MLRLLLFYTILEIARCSCPDGFEPVVNGQCRQLKPYTNYAYLADAQQIAISKCNEFQAQPIIIRNDEEQAYWSGRTLSSDFGFIILGIMCNTTSKKYLWTDGSAVDYKPPSGSDDITAACTTSGTWYMYLNNGGRWYYSTNSNKETYVVYCITQLHQLVLPTDDCFGFDVDNEDNVCYQIGAIADNWQDAQMICKGLGSNLASIHNVNENSFIRRLAVSSGAVHGVLLGATITGKGDSYEWIDGSAWDYENFYSGFHGVGDCIAMDTSTSTGPWVNVDCTEKMPVACARERKSITIGQRNVTCDDQKFEENTLITSPGFPFDASVSCDYFLTVDAGKRVEMEIVLLEANSCCDHLLIDEGYFGGYEIANLTGAIQNVTYTTTSSNIMKVSWQPNGGLNVRGVAITFRGV